MAFNGSDLKKMMLMPSMGIAKISYWWNGNDAINGGT